MPTDTAPHAIASPIDVYLFAHQDDEFGVYDNLRASVAQGRDVLCIYLTDGGGGKATPEARNKESCGVLKSLGIRDDQIRFLGTEQRIPDGELMPNLSKAYNLARAALDGIGNVHAVYSHAWEGGHPDHDAAHLLTGWLARDLNWPLAALYFFALYNADGIPGPFFRVLRPIAANGEIIAVRIGWADRLENLRLYLSYRSQWRSLLGLFPFMFLHQVIVGQHLLQRYADRGAVERPHAGRLLYEKRGGISFERFRDSVPKAFLSATGSGSGNQV